MAKKRTAASSTRGRCKPTTRQGKTIKAKPMSGRTKRPRRAGGGYTDRAGK